MSKKVFTMDEESGKILKALSKMEEPVNGKAIAAETGIDSKEVSAKIKVLKKEGLVDSPVRCKYAITDEGIKTVS